MASTTITAVAPDSTNAPQAKTVKGVLVRTRSSQSGIWVGIFAITMSFAALTSALIVREGTSDWAHLALPPVLYLNTLLLLASSGTFELSRLRLEANSGDSERGRRSGMLWLAATLGLGVAFCAGQYLAWENLRAQGVYLATNPNSSFFYVLTFLHVVHVTGGIVALLYLMGKLGWGRKQARRSTFDNTAIYWHFMGALWVYLLLLCVIKL